MSGSLILPVRVGYGGDSAVRGHAEIPALDGIRAVSFAVVFLSHTSLNAIVPGGFGVTVFFFLSGYLITTLLRREADRTGTLSFRKFYLRRVLRIFPPMYIVMAIVSVMAMAQLLPSELTRTGLLAQVLHATNYYLIASPQPGILPGLGSMWSLSVEEHFYFIFPLLYWCLRRWMPQPKRQAAILVGVCLTMLAWRTVLIAWYQEPYIRCAFATDTRADSILWGCILAIAANPVMDASRLSRQSWHWLASAGTVVLLLTFAWPMHNPLTGGLSLGRPPLVFCESLRYTLQGLALIPLFVCAIRSADAWPFRWLNIGWIKFVGTLSYSLYLIHFPMLMFAETRTTSPLWSPLLALSLSLLISSVMWWAVERPCARLRKRLA